MIGAEDEAGAVDQEYMVGRRGWHMQHGSRLRLTCSRRDGLNDRVDDLVHGFLLSDVARFRLAGRRSLPGRHRAVDEEARAIRTLDLSGWGEVQIHPGMAERPLAAVADGDHCVDVDGFEWRHEPPENLQTTQRGARL